MQWLFSFVLLIVALVMPSPSFASCANKVRGNVCPTGVNNISCSGPAIGYCCDSPSACTDKSQELDSGFVPPAESTGTTTTSSEDADTNPLCADGLGVNTAFGCLMAGSPKALVSQLLGWGVSVGGGIAFLMIVFAGFQMTTASGDPKRVQAARELMVSAISGLILIVLSILLLNFLGVNVLGLGSLGFKI